MAATAAQIKAALDKIEPQARPLGTDQQARMSTAISLKRIADLFTKWDAEP